IKLLPCVTAVRTLGKPFAGRFINPAAHKRVRLDRMAVMMRPGFPVLPRRSAVQTPHHPAELDPDKNLFRIMQIRLNRPHVMRLSLGGKLHSGSEGSSKSSGQSVHVMPPSSVRYNMLGSVPAHITLNSPSCSVLLTAMLIPRLLSATSPSRCQDSPPSSLPYKPSLKVPAKSLFEISSNAMLLISSGPSIVSSVQRPSSSAALYILPFVAK